MSGVEIVTACMDDVIAQAKQAGACTEDVASHKEDVVACIEDTEADVAPTQHEKRL